MKLTRRSGEIIMEDEKQFKIYEKAIEGRQHHQQNFNHWMNMYAIFNGALFVGYYTVTDKTSFFSFLLLFLGFAAGWSWHFSVTGFYDWIKSWITVVKKHEAKLDKFVVYRAYEGKKTISTQKLTKTFTLLVALAWTLLFTVTSASFFKSVKFCEKICLVASVVVFLLSLVLLLRRLVMEDDFEKEEIE